VELYKRNILTQQELITAAQRSAQTMQLKCMDVKGVSMCMDRPNRQKQLPIAAALLPNVGTLWKG
jgi:hypothetical protein